MRRAAPLIALIVSACGMDDPAPAPAPAPCTPPPAGTAPTYAQLYTQYFAPDTPGHCATAHCHADPGHEVWLCGPDKDTCYRGMVEVGLIDPARPASSMIGDPKRSRLSWVDPAGDMPFDAAGPLPAGRDAVLAWVGACAQNDGP